MLRDGPEDPRVLVILAHGAGAGADTPFLRTIADGLARHDIGVLRFEFPYMQRIRAEGRRRPPDRAPKLMEAFGQVVREHTAETLVIGGKSMGGRIASMVADDLGVDGVVCLGYPFHPPGKPGQPRTAHLERLKTPTLILQGTRDPFGHRMEVTGYHLSPAIRVVWMDDGDHGFKPRKASGHTLDAHLAAAVEEIAAFCRLLSDPE